MGVFLWARYPRRVVWLNYTNGVRTFKDAGTPLPPMPLQIAFRTGAIHLQENAPPKDPTVGLCLGS